MQAGGGKCCAALLSDFPVHLLQTMVLPGRAIAPSSPRLLERKRSSDPRWCDDSSSARSDLGLAFSTSAEWEHV